MNIVQTTFVNSVKALGLARKGGSWYLRRDETILVVELQKSNYGMSYFINVAVWLRALGESQFPKEQVCHIRTRLGELVGSTERLSQLLDLEYDIDETERMLELGHELTATLSWVAEASETVGALRSIDGERLRGRSLVMGSAQRLLAEDTGDPGA